MIKPLLLRDISDSIQATVHASDLGDIAFESVSTDTRTLKRGDLFVALKGERFDGHDNVIDAVQSGACAVVVEKPIENCEAVALTVESSVSALGKLGNVNRNNFDKPVIALTGSCGKTTTKEMIASLLSACGAVHATQANLNNHIGVPKTLLALPGDADYAVIEMGASGLGEIQWLSHITEPTVALVTNVMAAHMQGFGSLQNVADEKSRIYHSLRPDGIAVVNLDEPFSRQWMSQLTVVRPDISLLTVSLKDRDADVFCELCEVSEDASTVFRIHYRGVCDEARCPLPGEANLRNLAAAIACCLAVDCSVQQVCDGVEKLRPVRGRLNPIRMTPELLVIDDTYNANPGAVLAAVDVLMSFQQQDANAMLILGDLAELGEQSESMLADLGRQLAARGLNQLLTCGKAVRSVGEQFQRQSPSAWWRHVETHSEAADIAFKSAVGRSVFLVKGSRSSAMEQVVNQLMKQAGGC